MSVQQWWCCGSRSVCGSSLPLMCSSQGVVLLTSHATTETHGRCRCDASVLDAPLFVACQYLVEAVCVIRRLDSLQQQMHLVQACAQYMNWREVNDLLPSARQDVSNGFRTMVAIVAVVHELQYRNPLGVHVSCLTGLAGEWAVGQRMHAM
jgi:hypothetical protein